MSRYFRSRSNCSLSSSERMEWMIRNAGILLKTTLPECTGMMTDTGGFTYNSNNREIYFIISELLSKALLHDIAKPVTKKFIKGQGWTFYGHNHIGERMVAKIFKHPTVCIYSLGFPATFCPHQCFHHPFLKVVFA